MIVFTVLGKVGKQSASILLVCNLYTVLGSCVNDFYLHCKFSQYIIQCMLFWRWQHVFGLFKLFSFYVFNYWIYKCMAACFGLVKSHATCTDRFHIP